jgi:hypothetical protein
MGGLTATKISTIFLVIIFITLILSFIAIYMAIYQFIIGYEVDSISWLLVGFTGLSVSAYLLYQTKKRIRISIKPQVVMTTLICGKCGFKNLREFKRGDFVFKETDEICPKCNEKMYISAIYREVTETK